MAANNSREEAIAAAHHPSGLHMAANNSREEAIAAAHQPSGLHMVANNSREEATAAAHHSSTRHMAANNFRGNKLMGWQQMVVAPCGKQQFEAPREKSDEETSLGTYNAAVVPLMVIFVGMMGSSYSFIGVRVDPRVKGWLLLEQPVAMFVIPISYILFSLVWGPRKMMDRKPMQLKELMIVYNFVQVVFSLYMFIESGLSGWFFDYNYLCQPCDYSLDEKPIRMARVTHLYFLSKLLDFVDTFFFIARGKFSQVTNLHVIHHSSMLLATWFGTRHMPGGHMTFTVLLNSFVHTVMYSYYCLSTMGPSVRPYLWWKKYLTKMQLIQFVVVFLHTAQLLVFPCDGVHVSLALLVLFFTILYFALFINFYIKSYLSTKSRNKLPNKPSKNQNGHVMRDPHVGSDGVVSQQSARSGSEMSDGVSNSPNGSISSVTESGTKHRMPHGMQ